MVLDGKEVSEAVFTRIGKQVEALKDKHGLTPGLAVVLIGSDPASQVYVNMKEKRSKKYGLYSLKHELPAHVMPDTLKIILHILQTLALLSRHHGSAVLLTFRWPVH